MKKRIKRKTISQEEIENIILVAGNGHKDFPLCVNVIAEAIVNRLTGKG